MTTVSWLLVLAVMAPMSRAFVELPELFPFGVSTGDNVLAPGDDSYSEPMQIWPFKYFGKEESEIIVNVNGAISFGKGLTYYTPYCGALNLKSPMIAPFWADSDTKPEIGGQIFFRQTNEPDMLKKADRMLDKALPEGFNTEWLYIATWRNVTYFGADSCREREIEEYPRNTFQMILANDGTHSFVIFLYNQLQWFAGTASGGDRCLGIGGFPAKVGFDVGDGETFYTVPGSCTPNVQSVGWTSNADAPGKWVFRVDAVEAVKPTLKPELDEPEVEIARNMELEEIKELADTIPFPSFGHIEMKRSHPFSSQGNAAEYVYTGGAQAPFFGGNANQPKQYAGYRQNGCGSPGPNPVS